VISDGESYSNQIYDNPQNINGNRSLGLHYVANLIEMKIIVKCFKLPRKETHEHLNVHSLLNH